MLEIYGVNIKEPLDTLYSELFWECTSKERGERIKRFRREQDQKRSLVAGVLVKAILSHHLNMPVCNIEFLVNEYGKPYLKDNPIYFNISHSGDWVMVGISKWPIGIDVELMKKSDLGIAEHFFTENEYNQLKAMQDETSRKKGFYTFWSGKESYIKMLGKGLNIPLNGFELELSDNELQLKKAYEDKKGYFKTYPFDLQQYSVVACSPQEINETFYKRVDYRMLYNALKGITYFDNAHKKD